MRTGNSARNGPSACRNLSAPSGTKSSLVKSFNGSAISVFCRPRFGNPNRSPTPKIAARLAPTRSWISALPLRSNHSRIADRFSTTSKITIALIAPIRRSIATVGQFVDQLDGGFGGEVFVEAVVVELQHRRGAA